MSPAVAAVVFVVLSLAQAGEPVDPVSPEEAQSRVRAFYESLEPDAERDMGYLMGQRQDPERDAALRVFFGEVRDSGSTNLKTEALLLIDSLYVHVVPDRLAGEFIEAALQDGDIRVRSRAAEAAAFRRLSDRFADVLLALSQEADPDARRAAIYAMGRSRSPRFLPVIERALSDGEAATRLVAVRALRDRQWFMRELLTPMLKDEDAEVRRAAVATCLDLHELEPMLDDPDRQVRAAAIARVAELAAPRGSGWRPVADRLASLLDDPETGIDAMKALGTMGDTSVVPRAIEWLSHNDANHRRAALEAIELLEAAEAIPALEAAADHDDDDGFATEARRVRRNLGSRQR